MKAAISLPDETFHAADDAARRLGISRSELFRHALGAWLEANAREGITDALDAVCQTQPSALPVRLLAAQVSSLPDEDW